eukprot:tig00000402_g194.t1
MLAANRAAVRAASGRLATSARVGTLAAAAPAHATLTQPARGVFCARIVDARAPEPRAPLSRTISSPARRHYSALPAHMVLPMPALSPTMMEGNLAEWRVKEGDKVAAGTVLAAIETDKATLDWESIEDGVVAKILIKPGTPSVKVGTPALVVVESASDVGAFANYTPPAAPAAPAAPPAPAAAAAPGPSTPAPAAAAPAAPAAKPAAGGHTKIDFSNVAVWPTAKRLMIEHGLSPEDVRGSSKRPICKEDVLRAIERGVKPSGGAGQAAGAAGALPFKVERIPAPEARPATAGAKFAEVPHSQIKKITAQRLTQSKQTVPHQYFYADVPLDALLATRQHFAAEFGVKVSVNDFIVKAVASALREVPEVNVGYVDGKGAVPNAAIDVAVAMATDRGLIVPVVRGADGKGVGAISGEVKELAAKAKTGRLKPEEFTGGSITISNLGMFGVAEFSAIVNPPMACILAVGAGEARAPSAAVLDLDNPEGPTSAELLKMQPMTVMTVCLSADARCVDEVDAARFLRSLQGFLVSPRRLLL